MRLEYIVLIILSICFYKVNIKDYKDKRDRKRYINDNLKKSSKVLTKTGIIAYVVNMDGDKITIVTANDTNPSYLDIDKSYIEKIL